MKYNHIINFIRKSGEVLGTIIYQYDSDNNMMNTKGENEVFEMSEYDKQCMQDCMAHYDKYGSDCVQNIKHGIF